MEQVKGKLGLREFVAMAILAVGVKLTDDNPAILFENLANGAWMTPIFNSLLAIVPIFLLLKVMSLYPDKTLMDVIQVTFGKLLGYPLILSLWVYFTFSIVIDSSIYVDIIGTMYFSRTPALVIYFVLMAISAYGAKKGIENIGSVAWAVLSYIKVSLIIALILAMNKGHINFIYPFFGPGKFEILKDSTLKLSIYADFLFLAIITPYLKSWRDFRKGTWISLFIVTLDLTFALFAYIVLFDSESVKLLNYPFHEMIRYISFGFLTNLETFFFPFWLIASFVRFSFYLYLSALMFGWLFKIKNFEYIIPTLATLIVFIGMIPETPTFTIFRIRELLLTYFSPIFFTIPCLLWLVTKLKGVMQHEK